MDIENRKQANNQVVQILRVRLQEDDPVEASERGLPLDWNTLGFGDD